MGAVRFKGEFQSQRGVLYAIEIYDSSYSGSVNTFTLSRDGFRLTYDAVNEDRIATVIPSRLTFGYMIANSTDEGFITDLVSAAEGRFTVKVTRDSVLYWVGYFQPDISVLQDKAFPYRFDVTCVDGLGRLKDFDFVDSGSGLEWTSLSFVEHICNVLKSDSTLATRYYSGSDVFLRTSVNWWHTTHGATSTAKDPLLLSRFDGRVFGEPVNEGSVAVKYANALDVLSAILKAWSCRIYYSAGAFHVEQPDYRLTTPFNERRYNSSASSLSTASVSYDRSLPQNATGAKHVGTTFDWLPAYRGTQIKYEHHGSRNLIKNSESLFGTGIIDANVGQIDGGTNATTTYRLRGTITATIETTSSTPPLWYATFLVKLERGTYTLQRTLTSDAVNYSLKYGTMSWISGTGFAFTITTGSVWGNRFNGSFSFDIISPFVPTDAGDGVDFSIKSNAVNDFSGSAISYSTFNWSVANLELYKSTASFETEKTYVFTNSNAGNSIVKKLDSKIGDTVYDWSPGQIEVSANGSTWSNTTTAGWGVGAAGTDSISALLGRTLLAGQSVPVMKMNATFHGDNFYFHNVISDLSSRKWIFLGGTFNGKTDEWNAELWGVSYTATTSSPTIKQTFDFPVSANPDGQTSLPEKTASTTPTSTVLSALSNAALSSAITSGATTIPVPALKAGVFVAGQKIKIINPTTGAVSSATISTTNAAGATSIAISSAIGTAFPQGAFVVTDSLQNLASGGTAGASDGNGIYGGNGSLGADTTVTQGTHTLTFDSSADTSSPVNLILKGNASGTSTKNFKVVNQADTEIGNLQTLSGSAEMRMQTTTGVKFSLVGTNGLDFYGGETLGLTVRTDGALLLAGFSSDPTGLAEGVIWYNSTDDVLRLRRGSTTEIVKTGGTDGSSGASTYTPGGAEYTLILDAFSNAITVTLGGNMHEGVDYLIRCRRNGTRLITFNSDSGYTLNVDTDPTLNPTTFVAGGTGTGINAPHKTYQMRRAGSVIHIL